jgi:phosphoglycolate phosphatase
VSVTSTTLKAVIFDLDGTLVTFNLDVTSCRKEVIQYLTKQGISRDLFSMKETAFDMLIKVKNHLGTNATEEQLQRIKTKVFSIVEKYELTSAKETKLFTGLPETLKALKDMNMKLAVCTISGTKAAEYILERFEIGHFFDAILTRDDVVAVKPHSIHLQKVLETLDVLPQKAVLVGDSTKDMACAEKLKVLAVGVTTGLSSHEDLTHSGANYIASSVTDIPKLVLQLTASST